MPDALSFENGSGGELVAFPVSGLHWIEGYREFFLEELDADRLGVAGVCLVEEFYRRKAAFVHARGLLCCQGEAGWCPAFAQAGAQAPLDFRRACGRL